MGRDTWNDDLALPGQGAQSAPLVRITNGAGADIPAFSVCRISSFTAGSGVKVYTVAKPNANSQSHVIFTGGHVVPSGDADAWGRMWAYDGIPVTYSGTTPTIGDEVGTVSGQWYVQTGKTGLLVLGVDAGRSLCWVRPFRVLPYKALNCGAFSGSVNLYLTAGQDLTPLQIGNQAFTVEFWVQNTGRMYVGYGAPVGSPSSRISLTSWAFGDAWAVTSRANPTVWYHYAATRAAGGPTRVYIDGALFSSSASGALDFADFSIFNEGNGWGRFDEFRLSVGVDRYPAPFTPPSSPFENDAYTVLLSHFSGASILDFRDNGPYGYTIAKAGVPVLMTSPFKF
jgi:hypothetical protein